MKNKGLEVTVDAPAITSPEKDAAWLEGWHMGYAAALDMLKHEMAGWIRARKAENEGSRSAPPGSISWRYKSSSRLRKG